MWQPKDKVERCNYLNIRFFRFDCSSIEFFPTVCIVGYGTVTNLILAKQSWNRFLSWLCENKSSFEILGFKMRRAYHRVLRRLSVCSLLFYEVNPIFPSLLWFLSLVCEEKVLHAYTFCFVFMIAATNRNANCRHFLPSQVTKNNCGYVKDVDFALSAGK